MRFTEGWKMIEANIASNLWRFGKLPTFSQLSKPRVNTLQPGKGYAKNRRQFWENQLKDTSEIVFCTIDILRQIGKSHFQICSSLTPSNGASNLGTFLVNSWWCLPKARHKARELWGDVSIDWGLFLAKGILLAPTTRTIDDSFPPQNIP